MSTLQTYLPQDRLRALAHGETLPDHTRGAALFADISGFTSLTEKLAQELGPRRGIEELTQQINAVYDALINEIEKHGGSVVSFAGDAITCWFNANDVQPPSFAAAACGLALQAVMRAFPALGLKVAVTSGPVRRWVVGDPQVQLVDALAGATVARLAVGEHLAARGEVLVDTPTAETLAQHASLSEWRAAESGERFAVLASLLAAPGFLAPGLPSRIPDEYLRPWVLPAIFEREQGGHGAFLTELRPAVAVFLRFLGIDYDADEGAGQKLDALIRQAQGILARYGGALLALIIGDKGSYLYAVFGAPVAHEDDTRRAVQAALELRQMPGTLAFLPPVQIGISRGVMRVGAYGGVTRHTYGALGDDVNLAARLMQASAPGEILAAGRVQAKVATDFDFGPERLLLLKGKGGQIPAFAALAEARRRSLRLQEPAYYLPMVGRQAELQTMAEKLDLTLQGKGQIIGIVAEAGMGKSRLTAEAIRLARRKGFVGYGGACQSDGLNTPYLAWKAIWAAFFDVDPALPLSEQLRALAAAVQTLAPARVQAIPLLGALLNLDIPDNDFTKTLEPKYRQSALRALLEDCLQAAVHEAPLLIVIEDLHWVDALSHDLLEDLARGLGDSPICFMIVYRPPQLARIAAPRLESLPHFTKIELRELNAAEAAQIISGKVAQLFREHSAAPPPALIEKLLARTQGNPFYLEELLNFLHDRGLDPRVPDALEKIELPDSLHTLILSRIDQLLEHEKSALRVASIVGRLFRADWLTGYYPELGEARRVKTALEQLAKLDITPIDSSAQSPQGEPELIYLFKHIVTHEVTYESLPFATRARLHERLAQYLEKQIEAGRLNEASLLDTLAYHYEHSQNQAKQREYFQKAARAACAAYANDAAMAYYAQLLPLLKDPAERIDLHLQWGAVLELTGQWAQAEAHYQEARQLAQASPEWAASAAHSQLALGSLCSKRSELAAALSWLEQALSGYAALGNQEGLIQTSFEIGIVYQRKGEYAEAQRRYFEIVAQASSFPAIRAKALNGLGNISLAISEQDDYAAARAFYQESLALSRGLDDKRTIAGTLNNLGGVTETPEAQRAFYEESLEMLRAIGDKRGIAIALTNLGFLAFQQNEMAAARSFFEEPIALSRKNGDRYLLANSLQGLGFVATVQADVPAARKCLTESLQLQHEMNSEDGVICCLAALSNVAVIAGNFQHAAQVIGAVDVRLRRDQSLLDLDIRPLYESARAAAQAQLGAAAFQSAWTVGAQSSLEETVKMVLQENPFG